MLLTMIDNVLTEFWHSPRDIRMEWIGWVVMAGHGRGKLRKVMQGMELISCKYVL